ncbi:MAG: hypothetical protein ACKVHR_15700 [Pirellulales bacterium]
MALGNWGEEWKKAKKGFEKKTSSKKPPASVTKFFGGTGIKDHLKKCDEAFNALKKERTDSKKAAQLSKFNKAIAAYTKTADAYWLDIQKAMVKAKDKSIMSEMDILRAELHSIRDTMNTQAGMLEGVLKKQKIHEAMAANLKKSLTGACKRALLFIAKAKTDSTPESWNKGIVTAARDIGQQVGNIDVLKRKGLQISGLPETDAQTHFKALAVWANSPTRLDTEQQVIKERSAFLKAVQNVIKWADIK